METGGGFWYEYLAITDEDKLRISEMHQEIDKLYVYAIFMTAIAIIAVGAHFI
jgi:hypothetical protein